MFNQTFTFHNVSINSLSLYKPVAKHRGFTFHNVSINSIVPKETKKKLKHIYIP